MSTPDKPANGPEAEMGDLQLMRYLDGEVDDEAAAEIERELDDDGTVRAKLAGLELVGDLLRESVNEDERADGIADLVMAKLDEEPAEDEGAEVIELPGHEPELQPTGTTGKAANDNSRTIYALAGIAAAVAAGLFVWGNSAPDEHLADASRREPPAVAQPPEPEAVAFGDKQKAAAAEADDDDDDDDDDDEQPPVAIAQVDFGSGSGSVFYVSSGDASSATAVVWVTDVGDDQ